MAGETEYLDLTDYVAIAVDVTGVEATTLIKGSRLDLADSALPSVGRRGLLIHAESEAAREFYLHLIPELETSRTDDLHLVLFMKDARKVLAGLPYVRPTPGHVPGRACP